MNHVVIELKLANASARQANSALEWREKVLSLTSHVAEQDARIAAHQQFQDSLAADIQRIEEIQAAIQESIAGLQRGSQHNDKAIEELQVAASQTDEVVEHVVEAFGMMHKSMVEHGNSRVFPDS
jgi:septal ring factor EnvC (AmiA/AmiB activator)